MSRYFTENRFQRISVQFLHHGRNSKNVSSRYFDRVVRPQFACNVGICDGDEQMTERSSPEFLSAAIIDRQSTQCLTRMNAEQIRVLLAFCLSIFFGSIHIARAIFSDQQINLGILNGIERKRGLCVLQDCQV